MVPGGSDMKRRTRRTQIPGTPYMDRIERSNDGGQTWQVVDFKRHREPQPAIDWKSHGRDLQGALFLLVAFAVIFGLCFVAGGGKR